jgi:prepilin peptidase CpaA
MTLAIQIIVVVLVVAAAWSDVRTRRIPNVLTGVGAAIGLTLHVADAGLPGAVTSLEGMVLGLALAIAFFLARGMGAGDVKLLAAIGALLGPQPLVLIFVFTGLLGGIVALATIAWRKTWNASLPYGAVIAAGTLFFLIVR